MAQLVANIKDMRSYSRKMCYYAGQRFHLLNSEISSCFVVVLTHCQILMTIQLVTLELVQLVTLEEPSILQSPAHSFFEWASHLNRSYSKLTPCKGHCRQWLDHHHRYFKKSSKVALKRCRSLSVSHLLTTSKTSLLCQ